MCDSPCWGDDFAIFAKFNLGKRGFHQLHLKAGATDEPRSNETDGRAPDPPEAAQHLEQEAAPQTGSENLKIKGGGGLLCFGVHAGSTGLVSFEAFASKAQNLCGLEAEGLWGLRHLGTRTP